MTWVDLPYIHIYDDRHGKQRVYYRRGRFRQVIKGPIGSSEFIEDYRRIHSTFEVQSTYRAEAGTFRNLVEEFYKSPRFGQLAERSRGEYRRHLDALSAKIGALPAAAIEEAHILKWQALRVSEVNTRTGKPAIQTANDALMLLKQVFDYGVRLKLLRVNPAKLVEPIKVKTDGWDAWPDAALTRWATESRGTPRIAFYLGLYTAQRRGDVLTMRWDDIRDGAIHLRQHKTGVKLAVPLHPILVDELARIERHGATIIHKRTGEPITDSGFGSLWSRNKPGLESICRSMVCAKARRTRCSKPVARPRKFRTSQVRKRSPWSSFMARTRTKNAWRRRLWTSGLRASREGRLANLAKKSG